MEELDGELEGGEEWSDDNFDNEDNQTDDDYDD